MLLMPYRYRRFSSDERFPCRATDGRTALVFFLPIRDTLAVAAVAALQLHCSPSFAGAASVPRAFRLRHVSWVHEHADLQGVFIYSPIYVFAGSHFFTRIASYVSEFVLYLQYPNKSDMSVVQKEGGSKRVSGKSSSLALIIMSVSSAAAAAPPLSRPALPAPGRATDGQWVDGSAQIISDQAS